MRRGRTHQLSDVNAAFILLDFWGSWCPPCIGEFPALKRAYQTFKPRGLEILRIDSNESYGRAYPTQTALDKDRRIISFDREGPKLLPPSLPR